MNVKTETKETCWLCEENKTKTIGFIGDNSIRLGKDEYNTVAILQKYRCHPSFAFYHPNFCPECGRNLKEEKQMEDKIITYGVCEETFYVIQSHNNGEYYSLWFVDEVPLDMTEKGIENFMAEFCLDGCSVSGTFEQIMYELTNLIIDLH